MKHFVLFTSVFCILACLIVLFVLNERLDPQGDQSSSCTPYALTPASNGAGMIVSAHYTVCDDFIHDSAVYVFLHNQGERENPGSLIFRYADDPATPDPKFAWLDPHTISISVGNVIQVTKIKQSLGDIKIVYSIGNEKEPREAWDADVFHLKLFGLGVLVLLILAIFVCVRLSRSMGGGKTVTSA